MTHCRNILPPTLRAHEEMMQQRAPTGLRRTLRLPTGATLGDCFDMITKKLVSGELEGRCPELVERIRKEAHQPAPDDVCDWCRVPRGSTNLQCLEAAVREDRAPSIRA